MLKIVFFVLGLAVVSDAIGATWYRFTTVGIANKVVFFDADSLRKDSESVTIWTKVVNSEEAEHPGGTYATVLLKHFSCANRTEQILAFAFYDKSQRVTSSFSEAGPVEAILPGSVGEAILNVVCAKAFPNEPSYHQYVPAENNDVYATTSAVLARRKARR